MNAVRFGIWSLVALAIVGCQAADPQDVSKVNVDRIEMHDSTFDPPVVEVPAGTTITWAFTDGGRPHNVVGDGFASEVLSDGAFTHTFTNPGTYDYTCTLHSGMDGRVVVTDTSVRLRRDHPGGRFVDDLVALGGEVEETPDGRGTASLPRR